MVSMNQGGKGYVSQSNDGLYTIHGVAIGANDVTIGHLSGERKLWTEEVLRESAETLEGKHIVTNHENKDVYSVVGKITDARYSDEKNGVVYQGVIDDDELAEKIDRGWLDVSPRILYTGEDERGDLKVPQDIRFFANLSIVRKGAAPSNEVNLGEAEELAEELKSVFEESPEDIVSEFESFAEFQEGGIDYTRWMFDDPEGAQGASESFPCDGIHEREIDGKTWYMPCSSHDDFLRAVKEISEEENQTEELQIAEARRPEYSGTEERSWGDIPADTLSHYTDNLDYDAEGWNDLSQEQKQEITSHTLLGDPDADSANGGIFFPVVNASTGNLNRGALEAVRSGRGQSADIPQSTYESAYSMAGRLLNEEFDADVDTEFEGEMEELQTSSEEKKRIASQISSWSGLKRDEALDLLRSLDPDTPQEMQSFAVAIARSFDDIGEDEARNALGGLRVDEDDKRERGKLILNMSKEELQDSDLQDVATAIAERDDFEDVDSEELMKAFEELKDSVSEEEGEKRDSILNNLF